jgi:metal-responsive CopG/Arc/MetJ family transcriptional regulator
MEQIHLSIIVDEELRTALDGFAQKNQLSRSDVVRIAIKKLLYDGHGVNLER